MISPILTHAVIGYEIKNNNNSLFNVCEIMQLCLSMFV